MAEAWSSNHEHVQYHPVLSEVDKLNGWAGKTGFVHDAVLKDHADLSAYDIYACGPPPMINAIVESFPANGLIRDRSIL